MLILSNPKIGPRSKYVDPGNGLGARENPQFDVLEVQFGSELPILSPRHFGLKWAGLGPVFGQNRWAKMRAWYFTYNKKPF